MEKITPGIVLKQEDRGESDKLVTLLTPENLNDDYIQILLYPDKTLAIAENENKKPKEDAEETTTASTEDTNSAEDAAESTNADGGNE